MLDFERTFKLKLRLVGQFSKFFLRQQLFAFKEFLHGNENVQYLQNNKRHEFDHGHSRKLL